MRCTYHSTVFQSKENGFAICRYKTTEPDVPPAARSKFSVGKMSVFTAKGYNLPATDVIDYDLDGQWETGKYGLQLSVESFREIVAQTKEGIIGYLGSGLIKGIGPKTAEVIYSTFGMQTMDVLENHPEKLLHIRGISQQKLEKIQSYLLESRALRDIVAYLSPYEVSVKKAAKVLEAFQEGAMRILKTQPFRLCEIKGFGFKTVDQIARATKCSLSDPLRIRGGLTYLLDEAEKEGLLFLPRAELAEKAHTLLNEGLPDETVDSHLVELELDQALRERSLVCDIRMVYKPDLRKAEVDVARKVLQMLSWITGYKADIEKELALQGERFRLPGKQGENHFDTGARSANHSLLEELSEDPFIRSTEHSYQEKAAFLTDKNQREDMGYMMLRILDGEINIYREDAESSVSNLGSRDYI